MRDHRTSIDTDTLDPNDPAAAPAMAPTADPAGAPGPTTHAGEEEAVDVGPVSPRTGLLLALGFSLAFWAVMAWIVIAWWG